MPGRCAHAFAPSASEPVQSSQVLETIRGPSLIASNEGRAKIKREHKQRLTAADNMFNSDDENNGSDVSATTHNNHQSAAQPRTGIPSIFRSVWGPYPCRQGVPTTQLGARMWTSQAPSAWTFGAALSAL